MPEPKLSGKAVPDFGGRVWLCPHKALEHHEARKYFHALAPTPSHDRMVYFELCPQYSCRVGLRHGLTRFSLETSISGSQKDPSQPDKTAFTLRTTFSLFKIKTGSAGPVVTISQRFTPKNIKHALSKLDIPICNHIQLSDRIVSNHYRPDCVMLVKLDGRYRPCVCSTSSAPSPLRHHKCCPRCRVEGLCTTFGFQARVFEHLGRKCLALSLTIRRSLGSLPDDGPEAEWQGHILDDKQISLLPIVYQEWQLTMIQLRTSLQVDRKPEKTSIFDSLRDLFQCASFNRKPLPYVEDWKLMKGFHEYYEQNYLLKQDEVLKQGHRPDKDQGGKDSQRTTLSEELPPPPYIEIDDECGSQQRNSGASDDD